MISLTVEGKELDLIDATVSFVIKNPMFQTGQEGSYSYPFKVANTQKNREILEFLHRPDSVKSNLQPKPGDILINGNRLLSGNVNLKKASTFGFEVNLATGEGEFYALIKGKKLNDLVYPHLTFSNIDDAITFLNALSEEKSDPGFFVFPLLSEDFYSDNNNYYYYAWSDAFFNPWRSGFVYRENINNEDPPPKSKEIFVLFHKLHALLDKIFTFYGYNSIDKCFSVIPELENLCLFNIYDINSDYNPFFSSILNINLSKCMPDVLISDFLKELSAYIPIDFIFSHNKRTVTYCLKTELLDHAKSKSFRNPPSRIIEAEFDVPVSGYELKMQRDDQDTLMMEEQEIDENKCMLPVLSYDDLPDVNGVDLGSICLVLRDNCYYQVQFTGVHNDWVIFADANVKKSGNKGFQQSTLFNIYKEFLYEISYPVELMIWDPELGEYRLRKYTQHIQQLVPHVEVTSSNYPNKGLKLLFYRGLQKQNIWVTALEPPLTEDDVIPVSETFPQGGWNVYDVDGNKIPDANIALSWEGPYGLYETFWKKWIWWQQNRRKDVTITQLITEEELQNIDFTAKYRIADVDYFIKEIQVTITNTQIKPAVLKLVRV